MPTSSVTCASTTLAAATLREVAAELRLCRAGGGGFLWEQPGGGGARSRLYRARRKSWQAGDASEAAKEQHQGATATQPTKPGSWFLCGRPRADSTWAPPVMSSSASHACGGARRAAHGARAHKLRRQTEEATTSIEEER